jgi:hypothetical protein
MMEMKTNIIIIGISLLVLLIALSAAVQAQLTQPISLFGDQGTARKVADAFVAKLSPCVQNPQFVGLEKCTLPAGGYCLYYEDDPAYLSTGKAFHSFGWYSETIGCGALYEVVRGIYYDPCTHARSYTAPHTVLPPDRAWGLVIPPSFKEEGFWLNNPYGPKGTYITVGGHYFTCQNRNWDGMRHCFIFKYNFVPGTCHCICESALGECNPKRDQGATWQPATLYVLVWEDWCGLGDHDWDDFVAGLIPSNISVASQYRLP